MRDNSNYLNDLVIIYLDKLEELAQEMKSSSLEDKDYIKGQIMGLYDVLTIMESQADLFDISISKLENIDLNQYLMLK
jgi:hypothetical protein